MMTNLYDNDVLTVDEQGDFEAQGYEDTMTKGNRAKNPYPPSSIYGRLWADGARAAAEQLSW